MDIVNSILNMFSQIIVKSILVISIYYLVLSFFGLIRIKDRRRVDPEKSFALLVAAHNEEKVIQGIIHSLQRLNYPRELYDIFVIADNCTDKTAFIAKKSGALVYERASKEKRGKGFALEWMFAKLFKMDKSYDAVVVFDADNLVSKDFLLEMNKKLCKGYKVVQGYLDSKNPCDTWITGGYSIAFWTSNRMFQLSRSNLGLSNQLGGTGFCIDVDILKKLGWGATCLTEDLEFTCKLVLNGWKVGWAHEAVIYDEKPLTLSQSWWQRKRWMQGFADVSSRYFWKLMKRAVTKLDFVAFDCAIYSIQPIVIIITGLAAVISVIHQGSVLFRFENIQLLVAYLIDQVELLTTAGIFVIVMQYIYTPMVLFLEKKLNLKVFWYYILYPLYCITWLPIAVQGIIDKNKKEWSHTAHTRNVNITDLEEAN